MIPRMWLPNYLKNELGYRTRALVSMPCSTPTPHVDFDSWEMTAAHNDLDTMIDQMVFDEQRPTFYLLNTGETHYPYAAIEEPESEWPKIHGAHGVFKELSQGQLLHKSSHNYAIGANWMSCASDKSRYWLSGSLCRASLRQATAQHLCDHHLRSWRAFW